MRHTEQQSSSKVYLLNTGLISAAGGNTNATAIAVTAGINCYSDSNHYNKHRNPIKMARVPLEALPALHADLLSWDNLSLRDQHLIKLAHPAINECLSDIEINEPLSLFMVGSEPVQGNQLGISKVFIDALETQTGVCIDKKNSRYLATGRAGGFQAIDLAFELFAQTNKEFALVGGIESQIGCQNNLSLLDKDDRVLAMGVTGGFAPGEAACFLLLISEQAKEKYKLSSKMTLYKPGLADEAGHIYSDEPYLGEGLSNAISSAISTAYIESNISVVYSSMNGEPYGAKEFGVAMIRNSQYFSDTYQHEHPADCLGDIGAAFGSVLLSLIANNCTGNVLAYCSSDYSPRSAICMTVTNERRR